MVSRRTGRSSLGCLVTLLVFSVIIYFGVRIGEVYWRAYEFKDAMTQEARFARQIPDDRMLLHLRAVADSIGLPDEAKQITIQRTADRIVVETTYTEFVDFAVLTRAFKFNPRVENTY